MPSPHHVSLDARTIPPGLVDLGGLAMRRTFKQRCAGGFHLGIRDNGLRACPALSGMLSSETLHAGGSRMAGTSSTPATRERVQRKQQTAKPSTRRATTQPQTSRINGRLTTNKGQRQAAQDDDQQRHGKRGDHSGRRNSHAIGGPR